MVKIPVLRCTASQDIKAKPPGSLRHRDPFDQSSRRLSTVQPRRDTLRHSQCSPCYVVQPRLSWADRTDHEVTDAVPTDEMAVTLKARCDTAPCHARSRTLRYGRMYERLADEPRGGV